MSKCKTVCLAASKAMSSGNFGDQSQRAILRASRALEIISNAGAATEVPPRYASLRKRAKARSGAAT